MCIRDSPRENDLVVATHGRGMFIADISPLKEITQEVLTKDVHLFDIESKIRWASTPWDVSSSLNYNGQSEPNAIVIYYHLKNKVEGEVKITVYRGNMLVNEIKGTANAGLNSVSWPMNLRRERTEEEKKQFKERMERMARFGFRGQMPSEEFIKYAYSSASVGEYKFVLTVGKQQFVKSASILEGRWYDK